MGRPNLDRSPLIVHKFGGTSIADADGFRRVTQIVGEQIERPVRPVVVVSAMGGVTDRLMAAARHAATGERTEPCAVLSELRERHASVAAALLAPTERRAFSGRLDERLARLERLYDSLAVLGELTPRSGDAVMACGERLSADLLAATLRAHRLPATAVEADHVIVTDDRFGSATPRMSATCERIASEIAPMVEGGGVPVVTGFIAATDGGVTTTLGRSGSDRSAALVAAGLAANELWIWTDVDGILSADPHLVPRARTLEELSYEEAAKLARFGAEVLHPRTIRPIIRSRIPLRILNSFRPDHPGTRIVPIADPVPAGSSAIVSANGMRLLAVGDCDEAQRLSAAAMALRRLAEAGIDVRMVSQSISDSGMGVVIREQDRDHVVSLLRARSPEDPHGAQLCDVRREEEVAIVSAIGGPDGDGRGIASRAFAALGQHAVRVIAVTQAIEGDAVSFCIPASRVADTVRFLHCELGLEDGPPAAGRGVRSGGGR